MASRCSGNEIKLKIFVYNLIKINKYFFTHVDNTCVCSICNTSVAVSKKYNVERRKRPGDGEIRRTKARDAKHNLRPREAIFSK
jgi:hypothetical protein